MLFEMTAGDEVKLCPTTIIAQAVQAQQHEITIRQKAEFNVRYANPNTAPTIDRMQNIRRHDL